MFKVRRSKFGSLHTYTYNNLTLLRFARSRVNENLGSICKASGNIWKSLQEEAIDKNKSKPKYVGERSKLIKKNPTSPKPRPRFARNHAHENLESICKASGDFWESEKLGSICRVSGIIWGSLHQEATNKTSRPNKRSRERNN